MTKEQQRLLYFLEEDIIKLQKDVNVLTDLCNNYLGNTLKAELEVMEENPMENIDMFFSYWTRHINKLKTN